LAISTSNPLALQQISVNGAVISYVDYGQGEPVVFVHGSLGDYRTWSFALRQCGRQYRTITYSRRYNYPNPGRENLTDYSSDRDTEDLLSLIRELNLGPVYLVGASFGAVAAMMVASRHPELVKKLVVIEPGLRSWLEDIPGGPAIGRKFHEEAWWPARAAFQLGETERGIALLADGFNGPGTYSAFAPSVRRTLLENAAEMELAVKAEENITPFMPEHARRISVPTLILRGQKSLQMYRLITDELARHIPNAQMITRPRARHTVWLENPREFLAIVLEFLKA
jgi:non-heme chloroperoxidase